MITKNLLKYKNHIKENGIGAGFFIVLFSIFLAIFGTFYWCRKTENMNILKNNINKVLEKININNHR